jgi:hypothetical protein
LQVEEAIKICSTGKNKRWVNTIAKFDTGANDNWIATSVVEKLGITPEATQVESYEIMTGEALKSNKIVRNITWGANGKNKTFVTDFRIAPPNAGFKVLFGQEFISSEKIYTFNKAALVLTKRSQTKGRFHAPRQPRSC